MKKEKKQRGKGKKMVLGILTVCICSILIYLGYVFLTYSRIEDYQILSVEGKESRDFVQTNVLYTVVTQNIGFGAYTSDFTFFMDGGHESWGKSKESVMDCVNEAIETLQQFAPDFVFVQEADRDSTRSYHMDQQKMFQEAFQNYAGVTAQNYHSAFLMYPLYQPHGTSNSGIVTLSKYGITSALRRSLPISKGLSKLVDLDRCYSVSRVPVENDKELVLYNVHMSAYGGSDEIRTAQMTMLFQDMLAEYNAGNYCVCGGDFNHDFTGDSVPVLNPDIEQQEFGWAQPFPIDLLPEGISRCTDYTAGNQMPSCRNCDVPYTEDSFVLIVDGFIVSDNVEVEYLENYQTGFVYSDHCPVVMRFQLK